MTMASYWLLVMVVLISLLSSSRRMPGTCFCSTRVKPKAGSRRSPDDEAVAFNSRSGLLLLPFRLVERQLHDLALCVQALVLDSHFHAQRGARFVVRTLQVHQRDVFLQHRRPRAGGGIADLLAALPHRQAATHRHAGNLRRQADGGE